MVDLQIFGLYTYLAPVEAERHIQGSNVSVCVWLRGGVVCPCVNDSVGVGESGESHIMIIPFKFLTKLDLMFVQVMSYKHHAELRRSSVSGHVSRVIDIPHLHSTLTAFSWMKTDLHDA